MAEEGLKIEFLRSGGFAGLSLGTHVDTARLPPEEARELEELVASLEEGGEAVESPVVGQPDRFQYDLTVTRGEESRSFQLAEQDLTPEARELVKLLVERARRPEAD